MKRKEKIRFKDLNSLGARQISECFNLNSKEIRFKHFNMFMIRSNLNPPPPPPSLPSLSNSPLPSLPSVLPRPSSHLHLMRFWLKCMCLPFARMSLQRHVCTAYVG